MGMNSRWIGVLVTEILDIWAKTRYFFASMHVSLRQPMASTYSSMRNLTDLCSKVVSYGLINLLASQVCRRKLCYAP